MTRLVSGGGHNVIVEGHGRVMAAKKLGMKTVPVIHLDHLSDEQRRAYALAHNRTAELSAWDEVVKELELSSISEIDMSRFGFEELDDVFGSEDNLREQKAVDVDEASDGRECECPACGFKFFV